MSPAASNTRDLPGAGEARPGGGAQPPAAGNPGTTAPQVRDRITLTGITATGYHGVYPQERREGQVFTADVAVVLDTRQAATTGQLEATVNYAQLAGDIHDVLAGEAVDLIETLAQRVAQVCLTGPVEEVEVSIHKPQAPIGVPFGDVAVTIRRVRADVPTGATVPPELDAPPATPVACVVALGGNLGQVAATMRGAIASLARHPNIEVRGVSPLARTAAVGGIAQPPYLNAVVQLVTSLSPRGLLHVCLELERDARRVRDVRWGPRTLDLDIITYGQLSVAGPGLTLPHPRAHQRAFVLAPWAALDPGATLPGYGAVAHLAKDAPDAAGLVWVSEQYPWPQVGEDT